MEPQMSLFGLSETTIRLGVFASIFIVMALVEAAWPRKRRTQPRGWRWLTNLGMVVIDSLAVRIIFPVTAVYAATWAETHGYGLFNFIALPYWLKVLLSMVLLDMAIYWQHVASHKIPVLWRLHRVHHADRDIDVSTGNRFHPIEIVLSMLYKLVVIVLLGPAALGVFLFEVVLNGSAMFNHANFKLPLGLDRIVRLIFVTPDMHRVHHSWHQNETDSNYGFNLAVWDRMFGTYIDQPHDGHDEMTIGLKAYQTDKPTNLWWSLLLPFRK